MENLLLRRPDTTPLALYSCVSVVYPLGVAVCPPDVHPVIAMHCGKAAPVMRRTGRRVRRGVQTPGHFNVLPAHEETVWETGDDAGQFLLSLSPDFLGTLAAETGTAPDLCSRFQWRDPQLEHIARALQAGAENERLYRDSLVTAFAVRLLSLGGGAQIADTGGLSSASLRRTLAFIVEHLGDDISLERLAHVAGAGMSVFKTRFKQSTGLSPHQYVLRERVSRAVELLKRGGHSIGEVALATGFADQSHLTRQLKRMTGATPRSFLP